MKYLMGVDEGTTGCKACLFDETGVLVSSASREYPSYYPHPGWVEQDIEEIKDAVFTCIRESIASASRKGIKAEDIVAIKCLAYNHEPYIRECLEGFVMQKTNSY